MRLFCWSKHKEKKVFPKEAASWILVILPFAHVFLVLVYPTLELQNSALLHNTESCLALGKNCCNSVIIVCIVDTCIHVTHPLQFISHQEKHIH